MFERYTEKARRVIFFARYEASQYGSQVIDTEHLLLGLIREEKLVTFRWLPGTSPDAIRKHIDSWAPRQPPISTAIDLPLSKTGKRVLSHAKDEADRLNNKWIGTEHLLLGLLQEESPASKLLRELGGDAVKLRALFTSEHQHPQASGTPDETVQVHGSSWPALYIRHRVRECHTRNWHWQRASWKPTDLVVHRKTGRFSFDLALAEDSENFEILKGGWKKDHCAVCGWELFEGDDDHGNGYTNGRQWVCLECYDKFWERPDFASGAYSDLT